MAAGQTWSSQAAAALETLCRTYWYPLYSYVRRRGYSPEDAQDLTQGFFARLLQQNYPEEADRGKGKFRSFLLLTLNHFLLDERARSHALKRGGGQVFISLDQPAPEDKYRLELAVVRLRCRTRCRRRERRGLGLGYRYVFSGMTERVLHGFPGMTRIRS
jgi:DNA-directed RNA polymerase specialized sigma24 family protein